MRALPSLTLVSTLLTSLPSQTWAILTPAPTNPPPSVRRAGAMAFDPVGNRLLAYGGVTPGPAQILNETWSFNGQWTQLPSATVGGANRWGHQMVTDTVANRIVTFGGRSPTLFGVANDTAIWNGSTWSSVPTPTAPPARFLHGMSFDSVNNRVLVFGGRNATTTIGDTWSFDGTTWTQVATTGGPPARESMAMAYDASRNRTVVFGGYDRDTDTVYGDTWEFDGASWLQRDPAVSPSPRYQGSMAYDTRRVRLVMFGGFDGSTIHRQTYEYAGGDWLLLTIANQANIGTAFATEMYAGYDPSRTRFVTFGGVGTQFSNETWQFQGVNSSLFSVFGRGCDHSAGESSLAPETPPVIATNFDTLITNTPAGSIAGLMAVGFSDTTWNGNPLPFSLTPLGLDGCNLLVAADGIFFVGTGPNGLTFTFPVPNNNTLIGLSMFLQGFVFDTAAINGTGGVTRAARAVFGTS